MTVILRRFDQISGVTGAQEKLGMKNGVIFAAPIPEKYHSAGESIQKAVEVAVQEAEANGMSKRGKEVTPWILKRVYELSGGKSLPSSALFMCHPLAFTDPISSDVALIENTSLIGTVTDPCYAGERITFYSQVVKSLHRMQSSPLNKGLQ